MCIVAGIVRGVAGGRSERAVVGGHDGDGGDVKHWERTVDGV
jgi:hypothetical protein